MAKEAVNVLIVEDNAQHLELTLRALKRNNLASKIAVAKDGAQALDFVFCRGNYADRTAEDLPRLIILDLKLPKVDGMDVLRQIKADERTRRIPVVILTTSREEKDLLESYRYGVNSYIVKPVDFNKFMQAVGQLGFYWMSLNEVSNKV